MASKWQTQFGASAGKNDSRYWLSRIFRPVNDRGQPSPHYSMKVQIRGRRMAFGLGTANKEAAARRAAGIYGDLLSLGVERTLTKHRSQRPQGENIATIGEYLRAAQGVMAVRPATFAAYAAHLRRIAGDILILRAARKAKIKQKRATRTAIEDTPLSILTQQAVQAWRLGVCGTCRGGWDQGEISPHFKQFHHSASQEPVCSQSGKVPWHTAAT